MLKKGEKTARTEEAASKESYDPNDDTFVNFGDQLTNGPSVPSVKNKHHLNVQMTKQKKYLGMHNRR